MSNYPNSMDGPSTLYSPVDAFSIRPLETATTAQVLAGDTTIGVASTDGFAASYGILSIDDELIVYTGKTATQFAGCQRGAFGTQAAQHAQGATVRANMVSAFITALQQAVVAIETELGTAAALRYIRAMGDQVVTGMKTFLDGLALGSGTKAATGLVRLPNTGAIKWRKSDNSGDLGVALGANDHLVMDAVVDFAPGQTFGAPSYPDATTTSKGIVQIDPVGGIAVNDGVISLSPSGASPGTYPKVTVDAKGRVTAGQQLSGSDLPAHQHAESDVTGLVSDLAARPTGAANLTTVGAIPYVHSAGSLAQDQTSENQLFWNSSTHRLGVGTASPGAKLHISGGSGQTNLLYLTSDYSNPTFVFQNDRNTSFGGGSIEFRTSQGSFASPATMANGQLLGQFIWRGHDGTDYTTIGAMIRGFVDSTVSTDVMPTRLSIWTAPPSGADGIREIARFNAAGRFLLGTTSDDGASIVQANGAVSAAAGSASAPSFTFAGDLNTGIYRVDADNLGVSAGGTLAFNFQASQAVSHVTLRVSAPSAYFECGPYQTIGGPLENMAKHSEDFAAAVWDKNGGSCTVTSNAIIAPDGNQTADVITAATDTPVIQQQIAGLADGGTYTFYIWARVAYGTRKVSIAIVDNPYAAYLAGPTQITLTTSWQRFKITATLASGQTGLWIVIRQYAANGDDWSTGDIHLWGACLQQGNDPQKTYARTWVSQTQHVAAGLAAGPTVIAASDAATSPLKIHGPGSNLADSTLLELTANGELILAGGSGNGYRFAELSAANNPSGWAGVLKVKTPAGSPLGYILLYANP